jgi:phosphonoacetate hydrolase
MPTMIRVNRRIYRTRAVPVVAICLDGTSASYLKAAEHAMPRFTEMIRKGAYGLARSVIPSFTNPNNVAIVSGVPPSQNGICGNFYYDAHRDCEVMMDDPKYLRCQTVLAGFKKSGHSVAAITTKDKLLRLLGKGLDGACCSIECAGNFFLEGHTVNVAEMVGLPVPDIYDPEISTYCIRAGVSLMQHAKLDLLYLSTTDFVQHKYPPESPEAITFYSRIDPLIGALNESGAILGITADHGMNDKTADDGSPNVRFLETILKERGIAEARVILPITDPHVVHHGALGSYATVHLNSDHVRDAREILEDLDGIDLVLSRGEAARWFSLPPNRIGDLIVLADKKTVLGRTPEWHDLSFVKTGLRSHGGMHERTVPFAVNRTLKGDYARRLEAGDVNNYDLFDFLFNGVED